MKFLIIFLCFGASSVFPIILGTNGEIYGTDATVLPDYCYSKPVSDADVERFVYSNYSPLTRPVLNASQPVNVSFGIVFSGIIDIFEKERMILVDAYLIVEWKNELIGWQNVLPINCSKKLIAPANKVWVPDISVVNAPKDRYSLLLIRGHKVEVTSDGVCDFYPSGIFNATCSMNLRYFPFDEQVCKLRFAGWSYSSEMQELYASSTPIDFANFSQHEQWDLYDQEAINKRTINPTDKKTYDEVQIILHLRRKPAFYLVNLVIPVLIIAVAEITIFGLPISHGVKIHISFTALLAFTFFQAMMIQEIPRDSGVSLPLLTIYLDLTMAYIGCVLGGESLLFLVLRRAAPDRPPPPVWLIKPMATFARIIGIECHHAREWVRERKLFKLLKRNASLGRQILPGMALDVASDIWAPNSNNTTVAPSMSTQNWLKIDNDKIVTLNNAKNDKNSNTVEEGEKSTKHLVPLLERFSRFENDDKIKKTNKRSRIDKKHQLNYDREMYQRSWLLIAQVLERTLFAIYIIVLVVTPIAIFLILPPFQPANSDES